MRAESLQVVLTFTYIHLIINHIYRGTAFASGKDTREFGRNVATQWSGKELSMTLLLIVIGWLMVGCAIAWFIGNASDLGGLSKSTFQDHIDAGHVAIKAHSLRLKTAEQNR